MFAQFSSRSFCVVSELVSRDKNQPINNQQIRDPLDQLHGRGGLEMGYFGLLVLKVDNANEWIKA